MQLRLTVPASTPVVSVPEAKKNSRVFHDEDDTYFEGLIAAATGLVGRVLGRSLASETWEMKLDEFPSGRMAFPQGTLISVDSIEYLDADQTEQTIAGYRTFGVGTDNGFALPAVNESWPTASSEPLSVTVTFKAGYTSVPAPIKHACLMLVSHWYEVREAVGEASMQEPPMAVSALIAPYRNWFSPRAE